jgi:hypothetical protein
MGKYEPLGRYLQAQTREQVPMTFTEIERILNAPLPRSKEQRAWWSNNPHNNVMTRQWLEAGYETEQVDIAAGRLVFRRKKSSHEEENQSKRAPIFGCMKGMMTIQEGFDLTAPMEWEDGWDKKYEPRS